VLGESLFVETRQRQGAIKTCLVSTAQLRSDIEMSQKIKTWSITDLVVLTIATDGLKV